jgi:hypothetical protein
MSAFSSGEPTYSFLKNSMSSSNFLHEKNERKSRGNEMRNLPWPPVEKQRATRRGQHLPNHRHPAHRHQRKPGEIFWEFNKNQATRWALPVRKYFSFNLGSDRTRYASLI